MFKLMSGTFGFLGVMPPVLKLVVYAHIFGAGYYVWTKSQGIYVQIQPVVVDHLDQVMNVIGSLEWYVHP